MNKRKVILADSYEIFNFGLKILLEKDSLFEVIGETNNGEETIRLVSEKECDLLICDYNLPNINGIETLIEAKKIKPNIKSILISSIEKIEIQNICEKNKIDAFLFKSASKNEIVEAANLVFENHKFRPFTSEEKTEHPLSKLTKKELEILRFWINGQTMGDTGSKMSINIKTVETHRANIKKKLPGLSKAEIFTLMKEYGYF